MTDGSRPGAGWGSGLVILLSASALLASCGSGTARPDARTAAYVGVNTCAECHQAEFESWRGSHHDLAMQEVREDTVLGDFDDTVFEHDGVETRFFRRDGDYWVHTQGSDGTYADFKVAYLFGVDPLQQLLLEMPGGRLQCLTVAWDAVLGRWYDLYPEVEHAPDDALHWTGVYQNWNGMCADCHSTNLRKGYDPTSDSYETTYSEVDVACEACHGPGGDHVTWARSSPQSGGDAFDKGLVTQLRRGEAEAQLRSCAPCHSRRTLVTSEPTPAGDFHDEYLLARLNEGIYHDDGQILEEVYVFGSFLQSKMYARGVSCTDCHNPHSLEPWVPGDGTCLQCHSPQAPLDRFPTLTAKRYDTPEHHFHEPDSEGARCVNCHMIERDYMVVDPRHDHSFRIPRPDVSAVMGTPNACNDCHTDRDAQWAAEAVDGWLGADRERAPSFAPLFLRARLGDPNVVQELAALAMLADQPGIVRATAIDYLAPAGGQAWGVLVNLLDDPDPLVRQAATSGLADAPEQVLTQVLAHSLDDELRTVRIEAARALAGVSIDALDEALRPYLATATEEFEAAQAFSSDFPWSHLNLALVQQKRGDVEGAIASYERALEIDTRFAPARFNLANLYNSSGRNPEAVELLRSGAQFDPRNGEVHYSLGLALAEEGDAEGAAEALLQAANLMPNRPRVHYNAGLALQQVRRLGEAEARLVYAIQLAPEDAEAVHALALVYVDLEAWAMARDQLSTLEGLFPGAPWVAELGARIAAGESGGNPGGK